MLIFLQDAICEGTIATIFIAACITFLHIFSQKKLSLFIPYSNKFDDLIENLFLF